MSGTLKKLKSIIKKYHRSVIITIFNITLITCFVFITSSVYVHYMKESNHIIYYQYYSDIGECENDRWTYHELPYVDAKFRPPQNAVYIHASSCKLAIDSKEACAIESIAKTNPERKIYVFLAETPHPMFLESNLLKQLRSFQNVELRRIDFTNYAKGTALLTTVSNYLKASDLMNSRHTSEIMKYITLVKWGGVVLDKDVMVVKSLSDLPKNWVCKESENIVGTKAMALSMDDAGRDLVAAVVRKISHVTSNFTQVDARDILTKALLNMCSSNTKLKPTCGGITILEQSHFYPINQTAWRTFYESTHPRLKQDPYAFTLWSSSSYRPGEVPSRTASYTYLAHLARTHCPRTYEMFGEVFGT